MVVNVLKYIIFSSHFDSDNWLFTIIAKIQMLKFLTFGFFVLSLYKKFKNK